MRDPATQASPQCNNDLASLNILNQHDTQAANAWAMDTFNVAVWELDPQTNEIALSERARDLLGIEPDAPQHGDGIWSTLHPADRERLIQAITEATEPSSTGECHAEFRIVHPSRGLVWIDSRVRTIFTETPQGRRAVRVYGAMLDITEQKQAEAALRESEQRYRTLFDSIDEGFCVIEVLFDENNVPIVYRFLEINPAFERHTGLEQALGKTARELLPNLEAHWFEIYGNIALTGQAVRFENGSDVMQRWFDVYAFRVGQPESRKVALLFNNISQRKQVESEAKRAFAAEQTARAEAEAAVQARDQFLSIASHELRNPLTSVLGYANILQRSTQQQVHDSRIQRSVEMIFQQAQRLQGMIEHLLDVSRVQRGQFEVQRQPLDLGALVNHAVETFRITLELEEPTRSVVLLQSPEKILILGDPSRLEEVLHNLLSNAVKYSPAGQPVGLRVTQQAEHAVVEITDQGIGIPAEAQAHLFMPFYRARNVGSQMSGFGIGLYVVHEIIQRHEGRIEVESAEGAGSTFRIMLPLITDAKHPSAQ